MANRTGGFHYSLAAGLIILGLATTGCQSLGGLGNNKVATVNGEVITKPEFDQSYNHTLQMMRMDPTTVQGEKYKPLVAMFKKMTLQNLILTDLVDSAAKKRNITVSDADLQAVYLTQLSQMGGEKNASAEMQKQGLSLADFKTELKKQMLRDKLVVSLAGNKVDVSDADIKSFYIQHQKEFSLPEQVHAKHILIMANPDQIKQDLLALNPKMPAAEVNQKVKATLADKQKKAASILAQVKANPSAFESIAEKESDDKGSAAHGGDLGYFGKAMMVPPFANAAFSTKPGQIDPDLVQSKFGYHIIKVVDRKAPETKTFEELKPQIRRYLENTKRAAFMQQWLETEKKSAKIVIAPEYDFDKPTVVPEPTQPSATAPAPASPPTPVTVPAPAPKK